MYIQIYLINKVNNLKLHVFESKFSELYYKKSYFSSNYIWSEKKLL